MKKGDWVLYTKTKEEGIIKDIRDTSAFVVFECANDWDNYENYTAERVPLKNLINLDKV